MKSPYILFFSHGVFSMKFFKTFLEHDFTDGVLPGDNPGPKSSGIKTLQGPQTPKLEQDELRVIAALVSGPPGPALADTHGLTQASLWSGQPTGSALGHLPVRPTARLGHPPSALCRTISPSLSETARSPDVPALCAARRTCPPERLSAVPAQVVQSPKIQILSLPRHLSPSLDTMNPPPSSHQPTPLSYPESSTQSSVFSLTEKRHPKKGMQVRQVPVFTGRQS